MTQVGVLNPNSKIKEYAKALRENRETKNKIGECGHELKSRPLWMVGKSNLCFPCYEEQRKANEIVADFNERNKNFTPKWHKEFAILCEDADYADMKQSEADWIAGTRF